MPLPPGSLPLGRLRRRSIYPDPVPLHACPGQAAAVAGASGGGGARPAKRWRAEEAASPAAHLSEEVRWRVSLAPVAMGLAAMA
jgi:hypothetical protein